MSPSFGTQVGHIARRSIRRALRNPVVIGPAFFFPLFILAVLNAGASAATDIKGFPTDSYITFALGAVFVQGAVSAATLAGGALDEDIQSGFLSRLSMTPIRRAALLAGQLASAALLGVALGLVFLLVGVIAGADFEAGPAGAVVLLLFTVFMSLAFGSLGMLAALRTGNAEDVFPFALGLLFMSSLAMPRDLIDSDWFEKVATYNPMSYLIETPRSLLIDGWDSEALALGWGIAGAALVLCLAACASQLRTRMATA